MSVCKHTRNCATAPLSGLVGLVAGAVAGFMACSALVGTAGAGAGAGATSAAAWFARTVVPAAAFAAVLVGCLIRPYSFVPWAVAIAAPLTRVVWPAAAPESVGSASVNIGVGDPLVLAAMGSLLAAAASSGSVRQRHGEKDQGRHHGRGRDQGLVFPLSVVWLGIIAGSVLSSAIASLNPAVITLQEVTLSNTAKIVVSWAWFWVCANTVPRGGTPAERLARVRLFEGAWFGCAVAVALAASVQTAVMGATRSLTAGLDPNLLAGYLTVSLMIAASLVPGLTGWRRRGLGCVGCAVLIVGIAVSGSRAAVLGLAAGLLVLGASRARETLRRPKALAAVAALGMLGFLWLLAMWLVGSAAGLGPALRAYASRLSPGRFFDDPKRLLLWAAAWRFFRCAPLTGVGEGSFLPTYGFALSQHSQIVHNTPLSVLVERGVVGFALVAALFAIPAGLWIRLRARPRPAPDGEADRVLAGLFAAVAVCLGMGLAHNVLNFRYLWAPFGVACGLLWQPRSGPGDGQAGEAVPAMGLASLLKAAASRWSLIIVAAVVSCAAAVVTLVAQPAFYDVRLTLVAASIRFELPGRPSGLLSGDYGAGGGPDADQVGADSWVPGVGVPWYGGEGVGKLLRDRGVVDATVEALVSSGRLTRREAASMRERVFMEGIKRTHQLVLGMTAADPRAARTFLDELARQAELEAERQVRRWLEASAPNVELDTSIALATAREAEAMLVRARRWAQRGYARPAGPEAVLFSVPLIEDYVSACWRRYFDIVCQWQALRSEVASRPLLQRWGEFETTGPSRRPRLYLAGLSGLVAGLFAGFGIALLLELRQSRNRDERRDRGCGAG